MKEKNYVSDFTRGSIFPQLIRFAMPLFLSNMLQVVYNMADMVIVGRTLGKVGLSGVAIGGDVCMFLTFCAMGFSNASQVIISQYLGAGQKERLSRFIGTMSAFLLALSLVLGWICLWFRHGILGIMNTPAESYRQALAYSTICIVGMPFIYGYNAVSAVLRGLGDSRHPFVFISIAAVLNVALDLLFVPVMGMGAGGAALATVMSQGTSFALCAVFVARRQKSFGLELSARHFLRPDVSMLRPLLSLGVPMAIRSAAIQTSKLFVNSWINSYGVAVSAFAGIANKLNSISNLFSNALNTSGASMVGQNIGARTFDRVPRIMFTIAYISMTLATLMAFGLYRYPNAFFSFFTDDAEVIAIGLKYVPIGALIFYGSAVRSASNALINGSGNYRVNFAVAILDGIVLRIGLALFFGLTLGMEHYGFWLGDALAGFTPLPIGIVFYYFGSWKHSELIERRRA